MATNLHSAPQRTTGMTAEQIEKIKAAIKAQKWDKFSYCYAIGSMFPYSCMSLFPDQYKKSEVIERFYELIETKFYLIKDYTTFKTIEL